MNCHDAVAALIASLESGEPMTDEQREHIRSCARCRELLDSARQFQSEVAGEPLREPEVDVHAVEDAVRREHWKAVGWKIALLAAGIAGAAAFMVGRSRGGFGGFGTAELAFVVVLATVAVVPLVVLYAIVRALSRRNGKPLYRRLGPGRWWLGVCGGLSEATGFDRNLFRLGFFVLTAFEGAGLLLYLAFALAMPIHPADREHLWRFQAKKFVAWVRSL